MNILITGGAGYIGSHAVAAFVSAGYKVVVFDNFSTSSKDVFSSLEKILKSPVPYIVGDIRNTVLIQNILQKYSIDIVIHFAGLKSVNDSIRFPIEYASNNVEGTISILTAMSRVGVRSLVFSSSATVYGNPNYLPIDEEHTLSPISPYGKNKKNIEELLIDLANSSTDWGIISLRYFNPGGAHETGMIGENSAGIPNNIIPHIVKVAAGKLPYLKVYGNDYKTSDGSGVRDYIHVMDLVEGHLLAAKYIKKNIGFEVVNLGTGNGTSVLELINTFQRVNNIKIPYKITNRRRGDVPISFAEVSKAKKLLGWQAKRTIEDICRSSWLWEINHN